VNRVRVTGFDYLLLGGVVAAVAWGTLAFGAVYPWAYTPLAVGCAAIGIVALIGKRHAGPPIGALGLALAAVAIAATLQVVPLDAGTFARLSPGADAFLRSYDFSYQVAGGGHPLSIAPDKTMIAIGLFLAFALFLAGAVRLLSSIGAAVLVRPLVILAVAFALFGIVQATVLADSEGIVKKIYGFWQPRFGGSPFGSFVNRNHFAGWMIMVLPLAIAGICAAWEHGSKISAGSYRDRLSWLSTRSAAGMLLLTLAAAIMGLALLMTQSRSGMAAFAGAGLMFGWLVASRQPTGWAKAAALAVVVTLFVGAAAWAGFDRIAQRLTDVPITDNPHPTGRLQAWSDTLRIIGDFPWTGSGLDTYGRAMLLYQTGDRRLHFQEAHNDYLQIAAEGGALVGIPVIVAVGILVRDVRRRFREAPREGTSYWLRVGAVIGLVAIALQSVVEFSLQMPGNAALFAVLAAIALHRSPRLRDAR
jgi:O-antigen ligase